MRSCGYTIYHLPKLIGFSSIRLADRQDLMRVLRSSGSMRMQQQDYFLPRSIPERTVGVFAAAGGVPTLKRLRGHLKCSNVSAVLMLVQVYVQVGVVGGLNGLRDPTDKICSALGELGHRGSDCQCGVVRSIMSSRGGFACSCQRDIAWRSMLLHESVTRLAVLLITYRHPPPWVRVGSINQHPRGAVPM